MSSSLTPEQVANQALKEKVEPEAQVKYLQSQLGQLLREKQRNLRNSRSSSKHEDSDDSKGSNPMGDSSEEDTIRRPQGKRKSNFGDFKVNIPESEGQLDSDHFLDWLQTVERLFDYKDISDDKKVQLVALKLRKYASTWWANLVAKRVRKEKGKIRTCKMRDKPKSKFLPSHYRQDNYLKLHHLKQGSKSVEEYTREFEQLLLKCDLREDDAQI